MPGSNQQSKPQQLRITYTFPVEWLTPAYKWVQQAPRPFRPKDQYIFKQWVQYNHSWALWLGGEPVGLVVFQPIWWPWIKDPTDGYITFMLDRRVWGKGLLVEARQHILETIFGHWPSIQRVTGYTLKRNRAAQQAALDLGCSHEGTLIDAAGEDEDILIYGLTRKQFYGWTNNQNDTAATAIGYSK